MRQNQKRAAILLCSVALAAFSGSSTAKPVHQRPATTERAAAQAQAAGGVQDDRYPWLSGQPATPATIATSAKRHPRQKEVAPVDATPVNGGSSGNDLVSEARRYIGTNPTGRRSLWCGAFMDMVLKRTGHKGGGNLALNYTRYGTRVSGPQIGAIAVMGRRGGGHVGLVTGIDPNGNPIIVSGNHKRTAVDEVAFPRRMISAYVMPGQ
jgi:uncharacterized protein (TIGR02594 family)